MSGTAFDPARLRRVQQLFDAAIELQDDVREQLLRDAALSEPVLVADVRALIAAEERAQGIDPHKVYQQLDAALRTLMPDALAPGIDVGPYRVETEIGAGGMGRVFRARRNDHGIEHQVAIKVVRRDMLSDKARARFESERAVLARLRHAGICQFIDAGTLADGSPYFVMELLAHAVPIPAYADRERLDVRARVALFRKVLAAVAYAHQNLVVHRDIKSSNVLVLPDGQPKLLDFGIAKSLSEDGDRQVTATADRFFSIATAAPEQLTGEPVTVACDIYSLGVLLYELLAGVAPFDSSNTSIPALIEQIVHRVPAPMHAAAGELGDAALASRQLSRSAVRRQLGGEIEDIVQRCLRKDPNERYHSVDALDDDLQRLQEGLPISIRRGQNGYRLRKFVARHRIASALTAALLISLVASAWIVAVQNIRIRAERDQAEEALAILRDAFLSADPARTNGDALPARDVLIAAVTSLQSRKDEHPRLFRELGLSVSEVLIGLGRAEESLALLGEIQNSPVADDAHNHKLDLLLVQAATYLGNLEQAEATLNRNRHLLDESSDWQFASARLLSAKNRATEAIPLLRSVVARTAHLDPLDPIAQQSRSLLISSLGRINALDEAEAELRRFENQLVAVPQKHPIHAHVMLQRLHIVRKRGRLEEALTLAIDTHRKMLEIYGPESPYAATSEGALAGCYYAMDRFEDALRHYLSSHEELARRLGADSRDALATQVNIVDIMRRLKQDSRLILARISQAIDGSRTRYGPASTPVAYWLRIKAEALSEAGLHRDAAFLLASNEAETARSGASEAEVGAHLKMLASLQNGIGRSGESRSGAAKHP